MWEPGHMRIKGTCLSFWSEKISDPRHLGTALHETDWSTRFSRLGLYMKPRQEGRLLYDLLQSASFSY